MLRSQMIQENSSKKIVSQRQHTVTSLLNPFHVLSLNVLAGHCHLENETVT